MELLQSELNEALDPSDVLVPTVLPTAMKHSYHTTRWEIANRTLAVVDKFSGGRAGWVQRFFSFAFFGGLAALVNLLVFYVIYYHIALPVSPWLHNVIAYLIACELSLIANFVPNDYFTFSHLASHGERSWRARCVRYHVTSLSGSVLTFIIQLGFSYLLHLTPIIGEAAALIIVLFYNFSFHHLFTYRHNKSHEIDTVKTA